MFARTDTDTNVSHSQAMKTPPNPPAGDTHVLLEHFWVEAGDLPRVNPEEGKYVVTETVRGHLSNLARAVLLRRHPILLQGPTSSGKTSLVEYLAHRTGHRFVRINNHEHTDLQEYLGTYVTDETGACANFLRPVFPATSSLAVFPNSVGTGARKVAEHQRGYLTCLRRRTLA